MGGGLDPTTIRARADALGVLVRAGVDQESAAAFLGLGGLKWTGAVPVSLRLPSQEAGGLETRTGGGGPGNG